MQPIKRKQLLTTNNAKTIKGNKLGFKTFILYMAPFTANSKGINLCSHASAGCVESCLVSSGFGGMFKSVYQGRLNKAEYFLSERTEFLHQIKAEIERAIRLNKGKAIVTVRLNGTTDIRWEKFKIFGGKNIFEVFPKIKFYDYTKNHLRFDTELPKNYSLTFSRSETNHDKAMEILARGYNVAFVFDKTPKKYNGYKVINGDANDLRFKDPKNVIVGLKYKKMTGLGSDNSKAFTSGFAIKTETSIVSLPKTKVSKQILRKAA